ncbi:unnamed protein product [Symbiodinium sp. CCMP2592]|nr:unnamed protein product [Symbiodinium sp. CCMP2592]
MLPCAEQTCSAVFYSALPRLISSEGCFGSTTQFTGFPHFTGPGWWLREGRSRPRRTVVSGPLPEVSTKAKVQEEPEESREDLMKMSVSDLKKLLVKFGRTARGCIEKKDFVDRLKPPR